MKIFYHNDLDGIASAVIASMSINSKSNPEYFPINFDVGIPIEIIRPDEKIFILDFDATQNNWMNNIIEKTKNIVWIDHHITSIENNNFKNLLGLRDISKSGCYLTWKYFFKNRKVPYIIQLISDYDTRSWITNNNYDALYVYCGMQYYINDPVDDNMIEKCIYRKLLLRHLIDLGKIIKGNRLW